MAAVGGSQQGTNDGAVSSHGGSGAGSSLIQINNGQDENEAGASSNFWNDCFGTLYTVNKDRKTSRLFFTFRYLMEFAQLFLLMMGVQYGWRFDTENKGWQFAEFIQVRPFMATIGHTLFAVIFIAFLFLFLCCLAIYVWVFFSFQNNKFEVIWLLRLARLFGAIFYDSLDVMVVALMLTAVDCRYYGWHPATRLYNNEFPTLECMIMPNVVYFIAGIVGVVVYIIMAGFNKMAQMDLNPATHNLDAYAHPSVELWGFAVKMLMVMASVFLGDYRHLAIVWVICSSALCYFFWKWEPMIFSFVNYLRMGSYTAVVYVAALFMALQFPSSSLAVEKRQTPMGKGYTNYVDTLQFALIGIAPAFIIGALASFFRLRFYRVTVVERFRAAPPGARPRDIYRFISAREVEIVSRCCRDWADVDTLQPEAIALAERVHKSGLACLPASPFMIICYASFLVDVQGSFQSGLLQLQLALKLDASFIDKYAVFSREQDHTHKTANGIAGQNDVLMDVEFQKNYRVAVRAHKDAMAALRTFWQLLLHAKVRFEDLTEATRNIDRAIKFADRTYRTVLERHADQPRLLRLYAKFLERVKHDPWAASRWTKEADKLEQAEVECRHTNMLGLDDDGGDIGSGRISLFSVAKDGQERALCVFNSKGIMSMTNEAMRDMFGYGKAELKGKSVSMLMPSAFAEQLIQQVKNFVLSGHGAIVVRTSEVVAFHADHHMFGARITVVRILGVGEDSTFMASLEAVPPALDTATLWLLASGQVLSVDAQFRDWFGYRSADLEGSQSSSWTPSSKQLDDVLKSARHAMVLASQAAMVVASTEAAEDDAGHLRTDSVSSPGVNQMDAIAQALSSAAAPSAVSASINDSFASEWTLKGVRVLHKFAEPVNVDIKVSNTRSTAFCMHILSVRRPGIAASRPLPHMLVTSPGGPVVHVTEAFAALLGTTPKVLMANGSTTAMEALMVQPFGLMHRAGLLGPMPSQQPPTYSCRSGLSILMPILGSPSPEALPFRMQMKKRVNFDETFHVCTIEPSTWDEALDERSLRLFVDQFGTIKSVSHATPTVLFGFNAGTLIGHNVSCCITALRGSADPAAATLLELAARSTAARGLSWRVGVGLVQEDDMDGVLQPNATATSAPIFQTKMIPAVMTVNAAPVAAPCLEGAQLLESAAVVSNGGYELRLWRADMVTSIVEVDSAGLVVESEHFLDKLYPASIVLGVGVHFMMGRHVSDFVALGDHRLEDLYDESAFPAVPVRSANTLSTDPSSKKRSNIKTSRSDHHHVGPQMLLHGRHRLDGMEIDMSVQIVRKGAAGAAYLVLHLVDPQAGRLDLGEHMDRGKMYNVDIAPAATRLTKRHSTDRASVPAVASNLKPISEGLQQSTSIAAIKLSNLSSNSRGAGSRRPSVSMRFEVGEVEMEPLAAVAAAALVDGAAALATSPPTAGVVPPLVLAAAPAEAVGAAPSLSPFLRSPRSPLPGGSLSSGQGVAATLTSLSRHGSTIEASVSQWVIGSDMQFAPPTRTGAGLVEDSAGHGSDNDDLGLLGSHAEGGSEPDEEGPDARHGDEEALPMLAPDSKQYDNLLDRKPSRRGPDGSQIDEAENVGDDEADYRRGQRYKKLSRILTSDTVTSNTRMFKWHTLGITFLLTASAIAVYVVSRMLMSEQIASVQDLYLMGQAPRKMLRAATTVLDMGMIYQPYPNNFLSPTLRGMTNEGADLTSAKATLNVALAVVTANTLGAFAGYSSPKRMPVAHGLRALWETPSLTETYFAALASSELETNPYTTITPNATYIVRSYTRQISLFDGINRMVGYGRDVLANGDWYNNSVCTQYAHPSKWSDWTSVLYIRSNTARIFIDGWLQTLDGYAQIVISAASALNEVQIAILVIQGCVLAAAAELYMCFLGNKVDKNRHNVYSVFMVVPLAMVRTLATQRIIVDDADGSDSEADEMTPLMGAPGTLNPSSAAHADADGGKGGKLPASSGKGVHINIAGETTASAPPVWAAPTTVGGRIAAKLFFWRAENKPPSERRALTRSMRGVMRVSWPIALWGIVIIIINALGHAKLQTVKGPVMTFNTVNFFQCRAWRLLYACQLIQFSNDAAATAINLEKDLQEAQLEYTAMLFGHAGVPKETSEHFVLITEGIADTAGAGQHVLYTYTDCMSDVASGCLLPDDLYYQYTVHGLDLLVRHMFDVVAAIIEELKMGTMVTNSGPELQFMWKVREPLIGGTSLLVDAYKAHVEEVYSATLMLQTVAMSWTLALVVLYLIFILRPYLAEVTAETRRITELLTQLPIDIDVEGLVQRALASNGLRGKAAPAALLPGASTTSPTAAGLAANSFSRSPFLSPGRSTSSVQRILSMSAQNRLAKAHEGGGGSASSLEAPFLRDGGGSILQTPAKAV